MATMIQTTGETMTTMVTCYDLGLFNDKLAHLNKQCTKWGLDAVKVISRKHEQVALSEITGNQDDEGSIGRWYVTIQVPVSSVKVAGHTLIGTMEDLGAGQRMMSSILTGGLPECPAEFLEEDGSLRSEMVNAHSKWLDEVYFPACTILKAANSKKIETLRTHEMSCVHCNTKRARKSTLIFERESGELVQVGRMCAKEYFGVDFARVLSGTWDLIERVGGAPSSFSPSRFKQDFFLVYWLISKFGYVSNKVEESYLSWSKFVPDTTPMHVKLSTKSMSYRINDHLHSLYSIPTELWAMSLTEMKAVHAARVADEFEGYKGIDEKDYTARTAHSMKVHVTGMIARVIKSDEDTAKDGMMDEFAYVVAYARYFANNEAEMNTVYNEAMNFWASYTPTGGEDFNANVKAVAMAEANKSIGMTGMVVLKWMEATTTVEKGDYFKPEHKRAFPKLPEARFLAPEGGKMMDFSMTVMSRASGDNDFGGWYLVTGRTDENLEVTFFCKRDLFNAMTEGNKFNLRGKVKGHKNREGVLSTSMFFVKEA